METTCGSPIRRTWTIVRDLNGDDEADEYVLVFTDLGNLEHGLHGLNWAPDGKLYASKGNSRGYDKDGRIAPMPFRDLFGVGDGPKKRTPVRTFTKETYKRSYHHPSDHWGRDGGILRCDNLGKNLRSSRAASAIRGTSPLTTASTGSARTTIRTRGIARLCRSSEPTLAGATPGATIGPAKVICPPFQ